MNKKGEVFILAAIIIILAIYFIVKIYNYIEQPKIDERFLWLSENYEREASGVYNSLIYNDEDVFGGFINFTAFFTGYTKSRNPDFGMIYAVNHDNGSGSQIQVGNYLKDDVVVYDGVRYRNVIGCYDEIPAKIEFAGLALSVGINPIDLYEMREKCTIYVPFNQKLWFRVSGYWYPFEVIENKPQIMIISREEAQDQIQIYTDEIVQEDPGDLEEEMKSSCESLSRVDINNPAYFSDNCMDNSGNIIEYCSYYCPNTINSCRIKCEYYDGKEDDCRSLSHCGWDPIGKSGRGWCKEDCGGAVTCTDNDGDKYIAENVAGVSTCGNVCGPNNNEACIGNNDCKDDNLNVGGGGGCFDESCVIYDGTDNCASGLTCKGPPGSKKCAIVSD